LTEQSLQTLSTTSNAKLSELLACLSKSAKSSLTCHCAKTCHLLTCAKLSRSKLTALRCKLSRRVCLQSCLSLTSLRS
jgi:hypothetical protein